MQRKTLAYFLIPFFAVFGPFYQALSILKILLLQEEAIVGFAGLLLVCLFIDGLLATAGKNSVLACWRLSRSSYLISQ